MIGLQIALATASILAAVFAVKAVVASVALDETKESSQEVMDGVMRSLIDRQKTIDIAAAVLEARTRIIEERDGMVLVEVRLDDVDDE